MDKDLKIKLIDLLERSRKDWCVFAFEVLGANLDDEQKAILRSVQVNPKTSVKSGTARGKDFVAAVAALCFFYLTPGFDDDGKLIENTKVALTAPTDRQVKNIMMPEISRLYRNMVASGFGFMAGQLNTYNVKSENEEWFLTGFKADEHKHEAWSGFHAVNTCFIVTEASGLAETVYQAIEGNLQGNSRLLLVFNDNTGTGYANASQYKKGWSAFRLDSLNAPNVVLKKIVIPGQVDWNWVNARVSEWCTVISEDDFKAEEGDFHWENEDGRILYRPNDLFRVKVRGMAPKISQGALVPPEWVLLANERWRLQQKEKWKITKPLRLGVDVAGMGRDSSSWCHRFGHYVSHFDMIHSGGAADHMAVLGRTVSIMKTNTNAFEGLHAQAFIDTIGEGAFMVSSLNELVNGSEEKKADKEYAWLKDKYFGVKYSWKPEYKGKQLKDATGQYSFFNMRAYLHWAVRDWLDPKNKTGAMLPEDSEIFQALTQIQWFFRSDGSIQIEKKEEIKKRFGYSPDKWDGLANTFYPQPDYDPTPKKKINLSEVFH
jgi:hypothetical protein